MENSCYTQLEYLKIKNLRESGRGAFRFLNKAPAVSVVETDFMQFFDPVEAVLHSHRRICPATFSQAIKLRILFGQACSCWVDVNAQTSGQWIPARWPPPFS